MDIDRIEAYLRSPNMQDRLKGLTELRQCDSPEIAVPLLKSKLKDPEFLVRSFVAMGLKKQRTDESFEALLELLERDRDPNVRAEAANSLSFFGEDAIPHLVATFQQDTHWLMRRSILAAMAELNSPAQLLEIVILALQDEDQTVKESAIDCLGMLAATEQQEEALNALLVRVNADWWRTRLRVAYALKKFQDPRAQEALMRLRQDENHRVVGAAMEGLL